MPSMSAQLSPNQLSVLEARIAGLEARLGTSTEKSEGSQHFFSELTEQAEGYCLDNIISMARASVLSYRTGSEVAVVLDEHIEEGHAHGWLEDPRHRNHPEFTDTQGFWYRTGSSVIFVFRGTSGIKDIEVDLKGRRAPFAIKGGSPSQDEESSIKAHEGFTNAAYSVWPQMLEQIHAYPDHKLWFAGHSLGGAIATLTAYVTYKMFGEGRIAGLVTFGQPRVLCSGTENDKFCRDLGPDRIFRVYRSIDPVPHVPWFGYKHVSGNRCFIKKNGKFVYDASWRVKWFDWGRKLFRISRKLITSFQLSQLKALVSDHFSQGYLDDLVYTKTLPRKKSMAERIEEVKSLIRALVDNRKSPTETVFTRYGHEALPGAE